jgi:replicative DNA helicase
MADRVLPHSVEAERSLLGAILLDNNAIYEVSDIIGEADFYREVNANLYAAFLALSEEKLPIDLTTVRSRLVGDRAFESAGGALYLSELLQDVPTAANVRHYAKIVKEKSIVRRLIATAQEIAKEGYADVIAVEEFVSEAERKIFEVAQDKLRQPFRPIRELLKEALTSIEKRFELRRQSRKDDVFVTGVSTGFEALDRLTAGLQKGDLVILAARPSMGKCLTAGTLIDDPDTGRRLTIEECVRQRLPRVFSLSAGGALTVARVSDWVDSGEKPCFRVRTRSGREVEVTGHHPFLTRAGWVPLHDLAAGAEIAVPTAVPAFGAVELAAGLARHLGRLVAWGGLRALEHYPSDAPLSRGHWREEILRWLGGCDRCFPEKIWTLARRPLSEFLRSLLGHGAHPNDRLAREESAGAIAFELDDEPLARDLLHALTRFGVLAARSEGRARAHRIEITEPASIARYRASIEDLGEGSSPAGAVCWDEIARIDAIGARQVYDLSVPGGENFVAEDVFVHNTTLGLNFAQHAALKKLTGALVCSLEMGATQLVERLIASEARINSTKIRVGDLTPDDFTKLMATAARVQKAPLFIDDTPAISVTEVRAKARRLAAEHGLGLVLIDYLQLMRGRPSAAKEGREREISDISRGLKALAKELSVPVVALSQLNRSLESRADKRPQLSDLRESGAIEQDADVIMFIYRDDYYNKDSPDQGIAEVIVAKQRNGPTDTVRLKFFAEFTRFDNLLDGAPQERDSPAPRAQGFDEESPF